MFSVPAGKLQQGEKAIVISFCGEKKEFRKLAAFGLLPGAEVEVLQTFPAFVLRLGYTELAVDADIMRKIWVEKKKDRN